MTGKESDSGARDGGGGSGMGSPKGNPLKVKARRGFCSNGK